MSYHNTDLFDIPYKHETDDETGWMYRDEPHGGFLVYDYGACHTIRDDVEYEIPFAITVEFTDLGSAAGEPGYLIDANLTPLPEILTDENREKVAGCYDEDGEPVVDIMDVAMYGLAVPLGSEFGAETWEDGFEAIREDLVFGGFLPGWVLDRSWNRIGTTGWDLLEDAAFDEDAFQKSLDRLRERLGMTDAEA